MTGETPYAAGRRTPLIFLFVAVFVDMIGYGIVVPLLPLFVQRQGAGASLVGLLGALYALAQATGGPVLAGASDHFGRRPVLLVSLFGTACAYVLLGLADSLPLLVLALLLDGMTGGTMSTAQAYIADSTEPEQRTRGFGLIGAAFGLGMVVGPVIGGLLSQIDLSAPAFAAAAIGFANVLLGLVALPESLPAERRSALHAPSLNPLGQIGGALRAGNLRGLLLAVLLLNLAFSGLQSNFPLFSGARFGWDATDNAYLFAFVGTCAVLTQAVLLGWLRARLGERRLVLWGMTLMALNLGLLAVAPSSWMLYPIAGMVALGSNLSIPAITGLLSGRAGEQDQGRLMGVLQTTLNAALVGGPLLAGLSFDYIGMSAPYALGGGIALAALGVAWREREKGLGVRIDEIYEINESNS